MRFVVVLLFCSLAATSPAVAGDVPVQTAVLSKPGEPVEVRGPLSRVVGFFDRAGDRLAVTLFVSGNARGPVLRAGARLADGQRYTVQREGAGGAETVEIYREGAEVVLSISSGLRHARAAEASSAQLAGLD